MDLLSCRACAGHSVALVLDLGLTAPSRRFLTPALAAMPEPISPLRLLRCDDCGLLQLDGAVESVPEQRDLGAADDPHDLLLDLADDLFDGGVAELEIIDLARLHDELEYDLIVHETRCYFSVGGAATLLRQHDLQLIDVKAVEDSPRLRLMVQRRGERRPVRPEPARRLELERTAELDQARPWADFAQLVEQNRDLLNCELEEWGYRSKPVVAYSRGGRGMTLLAYCGIDSRRLPHLIDEAPHLHGLLTPGHRIPIVGPAALESDHPAAVLLLGKSWDSAGDGPLHDWWRRGGRILAPLPKPHYVDPAPTPIHDSAAVGGMSFSDFA